MKHRLSIALLFAALVAPVSAHADSSTVVFTFDCTGNAPLRTGRCADGGRPGSLIEGSDGNLYGTAQVSGEGSSQPFGGVVFSLTTGGQLTILHRFAAGSNGSFPAGTNPGLISEGPDGNLYGITLFGGIRNNGVLYRVGKQGTGFQILHEFCSATNCADGTSANGILVIGADGNIYGTTAFGGTGGCVGGCGAIFRVVPSSGKYEIAFNFGTENNAFPGGLSVGPGQLLYGIAGNSIFQYNPETGSFLDTPVHFPTVEGGFPSRPATNLILGPNGNFFGLYTIYAVPGIGMFEIHPDGSNLNLYPRYNTTTAGSPENMLLASDGNFWIANFNGSDGYGDIISISPSNGSLLQSLPLFGANSGIGAYPQALIQTKDGTFLGTTTQYGAAARGQFGDGTIYHLNAGLSAP